MEDKENKHSRHLGNGGNQSRQAAGAVCLCPLVTCLPHRRMGKRRLVKKMSEATSERQRKSEIIKLDKVTKHQQRMS